MKWPFKRSSRKDPRREHGVEGLVDLHSHVLPGVDDGAVSLQETTELLDGMAELGYATVVATPHFDNDAMTPSIDQQLRSIEEISHARGSRAPELLPGAEIPFDERFIESARLEKLPRIGAGSAYLLEFGFQPGSVPRGIEDILFRFQIRHGTIIIAHPERISDFQRNMERLELLIRAGCLLQVDLLSFVGKHGQSVVRTSRELLEKGCIHVLSSDIHGPGDLEGLSRAIDRVVSWDEARARKLLSTNPRKVVEGRSDEVQEDA